ncbi:MAG: hypothetical protein H6923_02800 [Alphaproteobacteria bacterium]|nr:hypothetical protein [Alphaproteobacteria bacterium]
MDALLKAFSPMKLLAYAWLAASLGVTVLALASAGDTLFPGLVEWKGAYAQAIGLYQETMRTVFGPVGDQIHAQTGFRLPAQSGDVVMAYAAAASAFTLGGNTLQQRESFWSGVQSTAASLSWPLAILFFAGRALTGGTVTRFATQHTGLFAGYLAAVAAAFAGMWYLNGQVPV